MVKGVFATCLIGLSALPLAQSYAECITDRITDLSNSVEAINDYQKMDNYEGWVAEIGKVAVDQASIMEWVSRAEEAISKIKTEVAENKGERL